MCIDWAVPLSVWESPGKQPEELVPGQLSSLLSAPFAHVFLFQLESYRSVSKARVPELPWPQSAICREDNQTNRRSERVCACVQKKVWCAICVCMHLFTLS